MADTVLAAGAVAWRRSGDHVELLMIHRPRYDDWTFPKGKVDRGERLPQTAVREVEEETGIRVRLGVPLVTHEYKVRDKDQMKRASYWSAQVTGHDDTTAYEPNHEVDEVRWVRDPDASSLLTYERDRELLAAFHAVRSAGKHRTRTLLILRHAEALSRSHWRGPDTERTLTTAGDRQAARIAPVLGAYGVRTIVSSDAERCVATVTPYADAIGTDIVLEPRLSEEHAEAHQVRKATYDLLDSRAPAVAATHRPVLPYVTDALGLDDVEPLAPGEMIVVHHTGRVVVETERFTS